MDLRTISKNINTKGYIFKALGRKGLLNWMNNEAYLSRLYEYEMGYRPDLNTPKTFNEKLQWLKIHDQKEIYHTFSDKYRAKELIAERIGASHVIPTLAVWKTAEEIDLSGLPETFVLKCNHDQGSVIVCRDKASFDLCAAKNKLAHCLKTKSFYGTREFQYSGIEPVIIAEPFLTDKHSGAGGLSGLTDFKFYCFNGSPEFLYIGRGYTFDHSLKMDFYDLNFNVMPFYRTDYGRLGNDFERPASFVQMVSIARELARDTYFVRIDLYDVGGTVFFSEFTLHPGSGFQHFVPEETDHVLGDKLKLPFEN